MRSCKYAEKEHNDAVLYGYFGKDVSYTDGKITYTRQPAEGSIVHIHTATPGDFGQLRNNLDILSSSDTEVGNFLPSAKGIPHYRVSRKSSKHANAVDYNPIFDIENDPGYEHPIRDPEREVECVVKLKELLKRYEAPECQYKRLGLE